MTKPNWIKSKGYLHITPNVSTGNWTKIKDKIEDTNFVKNYNFFPLIHRILKERKYKEVDPSKHEVITSKLTINKNGTTKLYRAHKHFNIEEQQVKSTRKDRHLYYSSHFDSLIYGYYSSLINDLYNIELSKNENLNQSIIAYRKILIPNKNSEIVQGKSSIHFAKEVFDEIKRQSMKNNDVVALAFDITNFFPTIDHEILKQTWTKLVSEEEFTEHHFKIFKACTEFKYVNYNELKKIGNNSKRRFNEERLNNIRKQQGFKAIFSNYKEFRSAIKSKELRVYDPFYKSKIPRVGIPQGLPISATLANIYMLNFDKEIIEKFVDTNQAFYRRYSDDIVLICPLEIAKAIESYIMNLISDVKLKISEQKTDRYLFREVIYNKNNEKRLEGFLLNSAFEELKPSNLIYLGFEFSGYQTLIKSSNLSKYYRRLIKIVDRRAKRATKAYISDPTFPKAVFYNQIKKAINKPLKIDKERNESLDSDPEYKYILKLDNATGIYKRQKIKLKSNKDQVVQKKSSYMGYIKKCVKIHRSSVFLSQVRKRKYITFLAIKKKLEKYS